jgi:hypothetical protein
MVKELLPQLLLYIISDYKGVVCHDGAPEIMATYCIVCGGKEGAAIESIEGGDETCALEEDDEVGVVWVSGKGIDEGGRGDGELGGEYGY